MRSTRMVPSLSDSEAARTTAVSRPIARNALIRPACSVRVWKAPDSASSEACWALAIARVSPIVSQRNSGSVRTDTASSSVAIHDCVATAIRMDTGTRTARREPGDHRLAQPDSIAVRSTIWLTRAPGASPSS